MSKPKVLNALDSAVYGRVLEESRSATSAEIRSMVHRAVEGPIDLTVDEAIHFAVRAATRSIVSSTVSTDSEP
jgi:hypothetical protein